eukprot:TRINITY_DN5881_c0_g1_i1.p1 TRINITY_DN5881_c0_g1~~TRINITY_DN5881_c0_g1_i1.p1  ORF type:complete len:383 (+),score=95.62 TRINITY_DN5881_c0_g1_i1:587-1735(+)
MHELEAKTFLDLNCGSEVLSSFGLVPTVVTRMNTITPTTTTTATTSTNTNTTTTSHHHSLLSMKLALVKTLWGVDGFDDPDSYLTTLKGIQAEGYTAIEAIRLQYGPPNPNSTIFLEAVKEAGLEFIAQIHTCGGYFAEGDYVYCDSISVSDHVKSLEDQVKEVVELGGVFANVHSGHDSWNQTEATEYFTAAIQIEERLGLKLVHETHRQRLLNTPYSLRQILSSSPSTDSTSPSLTHPLAALSVNADLSHWVCACEHVFDAKKFPKRDGWWPSVLSLLSSQVAFVHARVGFEQGPQVSDPRAPEFAYVVGQHLLWWKSLIRAQLSRGMKVCYIEPEFGPPPYMPTLPHSQKPVASLPEVVEYMKGVIQDAFREIIEEEGK